MLKMSFYDGTMDKEKLKQFIASCEKQILYTYGLSYRNPTTNRKPITKSEAIKIINEESCLDATEEKDFLHINAYSNNDLF